MTAPLIVFVLFVLIFSGIMMSISNKTNKKYGKGNFIYSAKLTYFGGLNLPQNVKSKVVCLKDKITIESSGQEFNLPTEKIIDVSIQTATQIRQQYVSSVGGAVAGAVLLGPLGAIIGGSSTKKTIKDKTKYLIFTYQSDGETKYLVFDVTEKMQDAHNITAKYKYLKKAPNVKVDL